MILLGNFSIALYTFKHKDKSLFSKFKVNNDDEWIQQLNLSGIYLQSAKHNMFDKNTFDTVAAGKVMPYGTAFGTGVADITTADINLVDRGQFDTIQSGILSIGVDKHKFSKKRSHSSTAHLFTEIPLTRQFPNLKKKLPYISLGRLNTPVEKLEKMAKHINFPAIYIKRDDFTGAIDERTGRYLPGGCKLRKFEFIAAEALLYGAKSFIILGWVDSNSAAITSIYAKKLGMNCICMLKNQENSSTNLRKNLLLHQYYDSELYFCPDNNSRKVNTIAQWDKHKRQDGVHPYIIPTGGSTPLGTIGFVNAAFELEEQIMAGKMPEPDKIYVACAGKATAVGLILGCKLANLKTKVIPVNAAPEDLAGSFKEGITNLFYATNLLLHSYDNSIPLLKLTEEDLLINSNFCGNYCAPTPESEAAKELMKQLEDINLDDTYTSKAFAALLNDIKENKVKPDEVILFWNTYCGLDFSDILNDADYTKLPIEFHKYFETV